mgnify:CR=1 FL=1
MLCRVHASAQKGNKLNLTGDSNYDEAWGNYKSPKNTLSILAHGNESNLIDGRGGKEVELYYKQLADVVAGSGQWKPGMGIELIACNAGNTDLVRYPVALSLSMELNERFSTNVTVSAPSNYIFVWSNGGTTISNKAFGYPTFFGNRHMNTWKNGALQ